VFAGAGISIDPPSSMPSFPGMVTTLAQEAGETVPPWGSVSPDAFLGRLKRDGFLVHDRVATMLRPTAKQAPNSYHTELLRLFRRPESVRIVTTNHDPFLSLAAATVFGEGVESFYAPALPVGDHFAGIVYLHGGVERDPERLVLTDVDFGRAYLTQGWATTFLRGMYSRFDVLFIGYSHGEPVLRYLASGLSATTHRYAFDTSDADSGVWASIGVDKIPYPRNDPPNEHRALADAVSAWSEQTRMGYLEHEARIRVAVSGLPPLDAAAADYVRHMLNDAATAGFFADYAAAPEWLHWMKQVPQFAALFGRATISQSSQELARWFATKMILQHSETALSLLEELGGQMRPELWFACAYRLWTVNPMPDPVVFAKWTTALLESVPAVEGARYIGYLLGRCRWPNDRSLAILLFAYLTDPQPAFEQRLPILSEEPGVRLSIAIRGDVDQLGDSWTTFFYPRISEVSEQLAPIVASQLVRAHEILKSAGEATDRWDPTSYLLPRIEEEDGA
jgi:hypothetical protein